MFYNANSFVNAIHNCPFSKLI